MTTLRTRAADPVGAQVAADRRPDVRHGTEEATRKRRRRLAAWSVLPTIVALAVAGIVLGRAWTTSRGLEDVRRGDAVSAVEWFRRAGRLDLFGGRELAAFDEGVAWLHDGELARARAAFESGLAEAGDAARCRVVVNLALTVEAQGDTVADADPADAQARYAEAKGVVDGSAACLARTSPAGDGEGDRLQRLLDRLAEKLDERSPREVSSPRADPDAQREPDDDLDELDRRLDQNAETRSEGRELEEAPDVDVTRTAGPTW